MRRCAGSEVAVWSRDQQRRAAFVRRVGDELSLNAQVAASAEEAARGRDIVVLAANSSQPVIDPASIAPGCHVTTLGPKQQGRAEFGVALAQRADVIVTDSIAQARAYQPPFVLEGTTQMQRLASLGSVLEGTSAGRTHPQQMTLFCSVGLAGTEVHLLATLADSIAARHRSR